MARSRIRTSIISSSDVAAVARTLGEVARDAQQALDSIPELQIIKFTRQYAEPMLLRGFASEPSGIVALRIQQDATPETVVAHGTRVSYRMTSAGIQVDAIDGMSVSDTVYRFTLMVVS